jgi:hypothetical protein
VTRLKGRWWETTFESPTQACLEKLHVRLQESSRERLQVGQPKLQERWEKQEVRLLKLLQWGRRVQQQEQPLQGQWGRLQLGPQERLRQGFGESQQGGLRDRP